MGSKFKNLKWPIQYGYPKFRKFQCSFHKLPRNLVLRGFLSSCIQIWVQNSKLWKFKFLKILKKFNTIADSHQTSNSYSVLVKITYYQILWRSAKIFNFPKFLVTILNRPFLILYFQPQIRIKHPKKTNQTELPGHFGST